MKTKRINEWASSAIFINEFTSLAQHQSWSEAFREKKRFDEC
jgi:hypothetical protein